MGSISWGTFCLSLKFHKEWNSFGRAVGIHIAPEGLKRVIEGANSTEGIVQMVGINKLGHH